MQTATPTSSLGEYEKAEREITAHSLHVRPEMKLLLVEDCPDTQVLLSHLLENIGFEVTTASDGEECLEKVALAGAMDRGFDLILLDLSLPGVSGFETARFLRHRNFTCPIIAITSGPSFDKRMMSMYAGCDEFLAKRTIHETILPALERLKKSE
jgi:CheY-like chemotaxis protein